ncbi:MAG: D-alanyl-D-alanine carboxypeptidase/D-alanyl-D-alanine-endopeptidase [Gemmatimonadota bacterium]
MPRSGVEGGELAAGAGTAFLATPEQLLQIELDRLLRGSAGERATVGAEIVSLSRGDALYSLNAERLLQPASNVKLFTSAAALHYLGPEFTWETNVWAAGPLDPGGVVRGALVLEGRGDPSLSGRFYGDSATFVFDRLAADLRARGVTRVAGDLLADNAYFEGPEMGEGWAWDIQQWWYAAQVDALSFNDNAVALVVTPGAAAGAPARVRTIPGTAYVTVRNEVLTVGRGTGQSVSVTRAPESNVVLLRGRVPVRGGGASVVVSIDDPARFALTVFRERLERAGVRVEGSTRVAEPAIDLGAKPDWTLLASHVSPPLSETLAVVNKRSQNFYAEQLLRTIGAEVRGRGSPAMGIATVDEFLRLEVGLEPGSIHMVDGSGLSRLNLVTPHAVVQLLAHMARHPHAREFYDSLLVPGEDARARRLDEPLTRGNVHAKTGTVRYVSAYSGYVTAANGERLAFSILVNNRPEGKASSVQLENDVVRALARFER